MTWRRFGFVVLLALTACVEAVNHPHDYREASYPPWLPHLALFAIVYTPIATWATYRNWTQPKPLGARIGWTALTWCVPIAGALIFFLAADQAPPDDL